MKETLSALILVGMVFLLGSLPHLLAILRSLGPGSTRRLWRYLSVMIGLFIVAYAAILTWVWTRTSDRLDILTAVLLFLGGYFVLAVTNLSHRTVKECQRIQSLELQVDLDPLTSLYNRRHLDGLIAECDRSTLSGKLPLSILLIDVDNFKAVNDNEGHARGDAVLCAVARETFLSCRVSDHAIRYGGDEFLVILKNTSADRAAARARQLCLAIAQNVSPITVSIGVATVFDDCADILDAFRNADEALYLAKSNGRNRVEIFHRKLEASVAA